MSGPLDQSTVGHSGAVLDHSYTGDKRSSLIVRVFFSPHLAEVWEREFDPIMVVLRTVYRRDVQSAMDRYAAL